MRQDHRIDSHPPQRVDGWKSSCVAGFAHVGHRELAYQKSLRPVYEQNDGQLAVAKASAVR